MRFFSILADQNTRADKILSALFEWIYSRSQIQKGFDLNQIKVTNIKDWKTYSNGKYYLKKGDVILVQERNTSSYKVGDIITFKGTSGDLKGKIVTHEIVGIKLENGKNIFYTKGIQNISEDPAVYEDEILIIDWQNKTDIEGKIKIAIDDYIFDLKAKYDLDIAFNQIDDLVEQGLNIAKIKFV